MTVFFERVFNSIANKYNGYHKHHYAFIENFYDDVNSKTEYDFRHISVNNAPVDFDKIPRDYNGTHLIRDPRDLLVSGYRYHLWCPEPWIKEKMTKYFIKNRLNLDDPGLMDKAEGLSYQEFLNAVDPVMGQIAELNWRAPHFEQMYNWDYKNPKILELKYEDIFNNEIEKFNVIFDHFNFSKEMKEASLKIVDRFSFKTIKEKNQTGEKQHANTGRANQWKEFLPQEIKELFRNRYSDLLIKLGYESDSNW